MLRINFSPVEILILAIKILSRAYGGFGAIGIGIGGIGIGGIGIGGIGIGGIGIGGIGIGGDPDGGDQNTLESIWWNWWTVSGGDSSSEDPGAGHGRGAIQQMWCNQHTSSSSPSSSSSSSSLSLSLY